MTKEIESLLNMALSLYKTLGENGYYDGEISLDNLGFLIEGPKVRLVLIDYGSLVNAQDLRPDVLGPWLRRIREHYQKCYQLYRLRAFAGGNPKMEKIVETYVKSSLDLIDKWMK
jgi:hypothetical protein